MNRSISTWEIVVRTGIASVGGYYFTVVLAVFIAMLLGEPRANAVITGVLWSFLVHTVIAVSAFAVKSPARMTGVLGVSAGVMLTIMAVSGWHMYV